MEEFTDVTRELIFLFFLKEYLWIWYKFLQNSDINKVIVYEH